MASYQEEHGIDLDRQALRSRLQATQLADPQDPGLVGLLMALMPAEMQEQWDTKESGCSDDFIASLPRVDKATLHDDDFCPICHCEYRDDKYPLVAYLPKCGHSFDADCIAVWLQRSTLCPLCRDNVLEPRKQVVDTSKLEMEDFGGMYG